MCEIAPGVYTAPRMSRGVRERMWSVLEEWWLAYPNASVLMTWPEAKLPGGQNLRTLGLPRQDLHDHHGIFLVRRALSSAEESATQPATVDPTPSAGPESDSASEDVETPGAQSE